MIQNINIEGSSVTAELHGNLYDAMLGESGVLNYGQKLAYEIVTNNLIKIKDGLFVNKGRFARIPYGSVEEAQIENGVSGVKRTDLIVIRFNTDGIKETQELKVLKGTPGGTAPEPVMNEIYKGGTSTDMPLYEIALNGLNIESVTPRFTLLGSITDVANPKPNLLLNSDFKAGIINQRGQSQYNAINYKKEMCVDRWILNGKNITATIGIDYVTFTNNSNEDAYLSQSLTNAKGKLCAYLDVKEITGDVNFYTQKYPTKYGETKLKQGENKISLDTGADDVGLYVELKSNASITFNRIKLEKGSIYTGMPVWNEAEEILKCKRYFQYITFDTSLRYDNNWLFPNYTFPVPMIKNPTISIKNFSDVAGGNKDVTLRETSASKFGIWSITVNRSLAPQNYKYELMCDANEY